MSHKHLFYIFIALLISFLSITSLFQSYGKMLKKVGDENWALYKSRELLIQQIGFKSETVILGDSRATAGFIPSEISDHVFGLSLPATSLMHGYYQLKYLVETGRIPKNLILAYIPPNYARTEEFWDRAAVYHPDFLTMEDAEEIIAIDKKNGGDLLPPFSAGIPKGYFPISRKINFGPAFDISFDFLDMAWGYNYNSLAIKNQLTTRGHYLYGKGSGTTTLNQEAIHPEDYINLLTKQQPATMKHFINGIFELTKKNNIPTYIVLVPISRLSYDELPDSYISGIKDFFSQYKDRANVDFATVTSMPTQYFGDDSHLNEEGAKKYSEYMKHEIFEKIQ